MSRFMFVVPPLTGHINPALGIAGELAERGHEVAIAGHSSIVEPLVPQGLTMLPVEGEGFDTFWTAIQEKSRHVRGPASLKFLWEDFLIPLGHSMVGRVRAAVEAFGPDVLVVDQQAVGAALVARDCGLPWATLAITPAELDDPYEALPGLGRWVTETLRDFESAHGAPESRMNGGDLRFSEQLTLVCSVPRLLRRDEFPDYCVFVGAPIGRRAPVPEFPWDRLDPDREKVLVSLGTVTREAGTRFLRVAAEAVAPLKDRLQAIVVAPSGIPTENGTIPADGPVGDDLIVMPHVPQVDLMPRLSVVVSHGGNNTVCEALAHGVPLVVAPVRDDQSIIAEQVVRAGAGVRVRFGRVTPAALTGSIVSALDDPSMREAAGRLRRDFDAAGGVRAAADHLLKMI